MGKKKKKIWVCNVPDYGIGEVADSALAMILNISRGITKYNSIMYDKIYESWDSNFINNIKRTRYSTLGIIGAGKIGSNLIIKANSLKFKTVFYDWYKEKGYEKVISSKRMESLESLLRVSDIVLLHIPLTNETKRMIDEKFIRYMKTGSSIVNTSRGKVVSDLDAFYDAIKSKKLAFVALDVLSKEPPKENKLLRAWLNKEK